MKKYAIINNENESSLYCASRNVIYLLKCYNCGIGYVGETSQSLRTRIGQYRSIDNQKSGSSPYIINQYNVNCRCKSPKVQVLKRIKPAGNKETDRENRLDRESHWIREIRTKFPYDLNDQLRSENHKLSVFSDFKSENKKPKTRGKKKKRSECGIDNFDPADLIATIHKASSN